MMFTKKLIHTGLAVACLPLSTFAKDGKDIAKRFIADMDAKPPEQRVPNWESTRALMMREAPKVGDKAPDFTLKTRDGEESIRLSEFDPKKPVVLIFGSWT